MRRLWVLFVTLVVLLCSAGAARADDFGGFDDPYDDADMGIPGWFIGLAVLAVLAGIGMTLYRVSTARDLARKAGLDTADATRVALLDDEGVSAAYVASQLHQRPDAAASRTTAERLQELQQLRDQGLVTEEEYAARRTAIIGSV